VKGDTYIELNRKVHTETGVAYILLDWNDRYAAVNTKHDESRQTDIASRKGNPGDDLNIVPRR
jgi:hypothetical protein